MTVYNQLPTQQNLNATMWIQQGFPASPNVPHATAVRLTKFQTLLAVPLDTEHTQVLQLFQTDLWRACHKRRMKYENMQKGRDTCKEAHKHRHLAFCQQGFYFLWIVVIFLIKLFLYISLFCFTILKRSYENILYPFFDLGLKIFSIYYQIGSLLWLIGRQLSA